MHELSLAQGVVQLLQEQANQQGFQKVTQVWLEIGSFACVEESALRFGLEAASLHSVAEGAVFHFRFMPANGWCFSCSQSFITTQHASPCPHCGSWEIQVENSKELRVTEVEVE